MSSFFTLPASKRKRKREDGTAAPSSKKRNTAVRGTIKDENASRKSRPKRDESISSDDSEAGGKGTRASDDGHTTSESESEDETAAERRLRLAEQYLQNIKGEVDEVGFDAEEIDKDLIAERLQEDVVCTVSGPEAVYTT
jgi:ribosomal RNA-processing protein 9